jgi:hypothetical protein
VRSFLDQSVESSAVTGGIAGNAGAEDFSPNNSRRSRRANSISSPPIIKVQQTVFIPLSLSRNRVASSFPLRLKRICHKGVLFGEAWVLLVAARLICNIVPFRRIYDVAGQSATFAPPYAAHQTSVVTPNPANGGHFKTGQ